MTVSFPGASAKVLVDSTLVILEQSINGVPNMRYMISDATSLISTHPWEVILPALVLTLIVLAFSFLGDGLRDAFDPRSKD